MTLHLSECPERAVKCVIIVKQKDVLQHVLIAASTHTVLHEGEVQLLRGVMHFQMRYLNNNKKKRQKRNDMNMYRLFVFISESQAKLDSRREKCVTF